MSSSLVAMEGLGFEVHVRNLPPQASQPAFKRFMREHLQKLSISAVTCQKTRNKTVATITFLNIADGQKFLMHHGQMQIHAKQRPTPISSLFVQLIFQNKLIYFQKSYNSPDKYLLRVLEFESKQRQNKQALIARADATREKIFPVVFDTLSVSSGVWDFRPLAGLETSELVYTPQVRWHFPGTATFGERSMILRLESGQRIDFNYSSIWEIISEADPNPSFIFSMMEPPKFFEAIDDAIETLLKSLTIALSNQRSLPQFNSHERNRVPHFGGAHKLIAGHCLAFRVILQGTAKSNYQLFDNIGGLMNILSKARGMPVMTHRSLDVMIAEEPFAETLTRFHAELSRLSVELPFKLLFQIQRLVQNNFLTPVKVLSIIPTVVRLTQRSGESVAINAVRKLANKIDFPGPGVDPLDFEVSTLIKMLEESEDFFVRTGTAHAGAIELEEKTPNVVIIHRATITPTGFQLGGPQQEAANRVLRKYPDHHDYFLRVRFCDEDAQQLQYNPKVSNDAIYHGRFKDVLRDGITIAGRTYAFLGFSHSSLRAQTCWFMAPFVHEGTLLYHEMLIQDLGNFKLIQSPAKCAARIGQAFSDTPVSVPIGKEVVSITHDIESSDRVFSDGVGTISRSLMHKIWGRLSKSRPLKPTCFQIRYSGAKGMLSLDTRLKGDALVLRPSMIKFEGTNTHDLEICEGAWKPLPLYLNRQFIKILEDMGVSHQFFLDHQAREIQKLRLITSSPYNASTFLRRQQIGDNIQLHWLINELTRLEIDYRSDGFLRDVVEMATLFELRTLKHKTRIPVPDGWHLHGIMDETGVLNEGEVFCIINEDGVSKIITGEKIIISRAPCLHPGDVQLVNAVTVPVDSPLMHLHNCVVFSQKGSRDLPSQLSGGDLDGDRYLIIWDKNANPTRVFSPADYTRQKAVDLGRQVERADITDHFVQFMETDQLGRCAVLHRVYADQMPEGTLHPTCVLLAEMHSTAVDFSKTGIPVDVTKFPRALRWRPDFEAPGPYVQIEKKGISFEDETYQDPDEEDNDDDFRHYRYYESPKILGKLYRAIDERKIFQDIKERSRINTASHASNSIEVVWKFVQHQCKLIKWDHLKQFAADIRESYEDLLFQIMTDYSEHPSRPLTELEIVVGNILGRTGAQSRRQLNDSVSLKEKFDADSEYIINRITHDENGYSPESLERSMACLAVSLEEWNPRGGERLLSFKYVAAAICLREVERL